MSDNIVQMSKEKHVLHRIIPLLFLPAVGLLVLLAIFIQYVEITKDNNSFINLAGRQRLVAQQIGIEAHMLEMDQKAEVMIRPDYDRKKKGDIKRLQRNMQDYDRALHRIEFGGETIFGKEISPLPGFAVPELANVKRLWHDYKKELQTILNPASDKSSTAPFHFIANNTARLVELSERLVTSYEARMDERRQQVILILVIFIVIGIASIIGVIFVVSRFVKERRQIELALEKNRERFDLAVRGTNDGIWDWDLNTDQIYFSERWKEMLGYEEDEIGDNFSSWRDLIHPDDLGDFLNKWSDYMAGLSDHLQIEYRLKRKNNSYAWILCRGLSSMGEGEQPGRLSGSHTDITDQMQSFEILQEEKRQQARLLLKLQAAQESILHSEERLRYSQIFSHVGNMDWDIEKDELYLSELSAQILGYQPTEKIISINEFLEIVSSEDRDKVSNAINECRYHGTGYDLDSRVILPSGEERWVHGRGDAVRDENNHATNILGMLQDITARKRADIRLANSVRELNETNSELVETQAKLKKSKEWLQSILDIAPEAIIVFNSERRITVFNRGAETIFGYQEAEVAGKPLELLLPERFRDSHHQHVKSFEMDRSDSLEMRSRSEVRGLRKDGSEFPVGASVSKSGQGSDLTFTVIIRDLTKQKEIDDIIQKEQAEQAALIVKLRDAQNQLLQSEKLASIGQLAAGVAHEINNPVGYINSNLGTLQNYLHDLVEIIEMYQVYEPIFEQHKEIYKLIKQVEETKELEYLKADIQDLLNESVDGVSRVKQIVQDLKDFSHTDAGEWHWGDIHKGINSTLNVAHNELKYKADVIKEYGELPEIECIISQLNQVFMNLLVNAAHAIEDRGTITIRTGVENEGVWVEVEDTGKGMDEETRRRIFEPFFTTKPVGSGTGLGLSLSYGIIQKHNGTINVSSEVGKGSIFHLWLPINHTNNDDAH